VLSLVAQEQNTISLPVRKPRRFLPDDYNVSTWENLQPYFEDLANRDISDVAQLENWLLDRSELDAVLEEDLAMRYIRMNIDTTNAEFSEAFNFFVSEIEPNIAPYSNTFDKKIISSDAAKDLSTEKYGIFLRKIRKNIEIFREKNIPLQMKLQTDSQKFGAIAAKMMVDIDGKQVTMQKASTHFKSTNREKRKRVFDLMTERRSEDAASLNELFSSLIQMRDEVARNADFPNFRDYMFAYLGRFDYSVKDCYDFHESIVTEIKPIVNQFYATRKKALKVERLRTWDTQVDISGKKALKPFKGGAELAQKTIECLAKVRPFFGECLEIMREMGHLDLESKSGKAPGGFNYPLYEIGVPFIFMNAVGSLRDLVTMVHEGGHAIHSFLSRDLELTDFKNLPSEVAELASMTMELISMEHWDIIFDDPEELKRAKREQLETIITVLPWIAKVDAFQHWVYENPNHSVEERLEEWVSICKRFDSDIEDWSGYEDALKLSWQKQLHLFEVPFYYIEYGMAQLGAIAVWRNYKKDPEKALDQYVEALKLGYTASIGDIYKTAGIKFDFSKETVKELADFVKQELEKLK